MQLRILTRDLWTVLAVCSDEGRCDVVEFADRLQRDDRRGYVRLSRAFRRLAEAGPPHNDTRFRSVGHDVFELKTQGGVRVFCFLDEHRVVVCDQAMRKPKAKGLAAAIDHAARVRWRYLVDKRGGKLNVVEAS